jgi:hypothetical protein
MDKSYTHVNSLKTLSSEPETALSKTIPATHEVHQWLATHRALHPLTQQDRRPQLSPLLHRPGKRPTSPTLGCPHPERNAKRQRFLTVAFTNFYHTSNTAQLLHELISQNIIQWFQNPQCQHRMPRSHPLFRQASPCNNSRSLAGSTSSKGAYPNHS